MGGGRIYEKCISEIVCCFSDVIFDFVLLFIMLCRYFILLSGNWEHGDMCRGIQDRTRRSWEAAAEKGFQKTVHLLLDNGADIEGQDNRARTALHLAAMNGHYEIVKLPLERAANSTVVNKFGRILGCDKRTYTCSTAAAPSQV